MRCGRKGDLSRCAWAGQGTAYRAPHEFGVVGLGLGQEFG